MLDAGRGPDPRQTNQQASVEDSSVSSAVKNLYRLGIPREEGNRSGSFFCGFAGVLANTSTPAACRNSNRGSVDSAVDLPLPLAEQPGKSHPVLPRYQRIEGVNFLSPKIAINFTQVAGFNDNVVGTRCRRMTDGVSGISQRRGTVSVSTK